MPRSVLLHIDNVYTPGIPDHRMRDLSFPRPEQIKQALADGLYVAVATSDLADPEDVWVATQNGHPGPSSWSREHGHSVSALGDGFLTDDAGREYGYRSSMVGDIVLLDGHAHYVASIGFEDLGIDVDPGTIRVVGGGMLAEALTPGITP